MEKSPQEAYANAALLYGSLMNELGLEPLSKARRPPTRTGQPSKSKIQPSTTIRNKTLPYPRF